MSVVAIIAALVMGFVLGLLGGGGSILAVPILVFLVGLGEKAAIATSLLVVGATSALAATSHARSQNVAWRTGIIFGAFAMGGAYGGGRLAAFIPGPVLLTAFAVIMLVAATLMLRGQAPVEETDEAKPVHVPFVKLTAMGLGVGALTGLVGAGGGFVIVPALVVLGGLSMRRAIGTSLAVIALNSFAGLAGYLGHQSIDLELAAGFVAASIVGTLLGTATSRRVQSEGLRTGFAYFILISGTLIFGEQLGWPILANLVVAGVLTLIALGIHLRRK